MKPAVGALILILTVQAQAPPTQYWIRFWQRSASLDQPVVIRSCLLIAHSGNYYMQRTVQEFPGAGNLRYHSGTLDQEVMTHLLALANDERLQQLSLQEVRLDQHKLIRELDQSTIYIRRGEWDQELAFANVDGQEIEPEELKPIRHFLKSLALRELPEDKQLKSRKLDICKEASRRGPERGRRRLPQ
jgi:hypothetical protein